ncbi:aldose epimerase [Leptolyngbya sp. 7M]|uniref:aldose epimerase family protein n=1 Tax=Leptolyngbya sp. 7M TaxID=2812896 RepID=UPI001B8B3090|nr:aldose epimerase [Leptolyngbya sp. 7M]QYO62879.1 aldose epimerase [Leptolyngbya sp. 7M]
MFAVTTEQRQYKTYILTDQSSSACLEVVPERGGIITRWQVQHQELLYLDAERFSHPEQTVRGGVPILFPICGNLPNNLYTYGGQQYSLKQHGFARDLPWQVIDQASQDAASITLQLTSNEQTRQSYPFDFQLNFTYQLQGHSLILQQRHTNRSDQPMPFSTGLHPYFLVGDKTQLQFEIPAVQFQDQQTQTLHPFTGNFDFDQDEIDVAFRQLGQQSTRVTDHQRQFRLTLDYDATYSTLVFWTINGKDYYCLEPWSGPRNALNTGENLVQLEAGATLETRVRLNVEFLK